MKVESKTLLLDLIERTRVNMNEAKKFEHLDKELMWKSRADTWNVLECVEHLNLYGDYYLPAIKKAIETTSTPSAAIYKTGWLGNYFAEQMRSDQNGKKTRKMKTFADKNPLNTPLTKACLQRFIAQQEQLLQLLHHSQQVDLGKVRVPVSFSPLIKLKLGDTFRFFINHIDRHIQQANKVLETLGD